MSESKHGSTSVASSPSEPKAKPLTRFWIALERLPGQAAVAALWQRLLQTDFPLVGRLALPEPILASSYPRLDGNGGPYTVYEHGAEVLVGICEEDGRRVSLAERDLVVYRIDPGRLTRSIAEVFEVVADSSPCGAHPNTWIVGLYRPVAGYDFPLVLTLQHDSHEFQQAVAAIVAYFATPFLLLSPTNHFHRAASSLLLEWHCCGFMALADAIAVDDSGSWYLSPTGEEQLDVFRTRALPLEKANPDPMFFPTPAQACWADLQLRFRTGIRSTRPSARRHEV